VDLSKKGNDTILLEVDPGSVVESEHDGGQ
jgi:hypothetical protein